MTQARSAALARVTSLLPQRSDWTHARPGRDLIAGIMVGLVALPLALGFGASSGMGATAGLITAIVAGAVAAIFGGSRVQVSGPTGAMTVVLVPIIATYGPDGVLVVGLLAGLILIGLGYAGAGRFIRYVPVPVVEGFTVGIAVIIALQQAAAVLGVRTGDAESVVGIALSAAATWLAAPTWTSPAIAAGVALSMLVAARVRPGLPVSFAAVGIVTALTAWLDLPVATIGAIPAGLPLPALPNLVGIDVTRLILPAVAVAALAAFESLLSATVADGMRVGERHDSDRELFGQGIANLVVPLFGGVPATAAIARTAVNVRSGARTRLSAIVHAAVLLVVVMAAAGLVSKIPLAALGGVLIATAVQMIEVSSLWALVRSTRGDAVVLVLTAIATIAVDLVTAVILGLIVAGAFALQQVARSARLDEIALDRGDHADEESALLDEHIVAFRLDGALFFGAAHAFLLELAEVSDVRVVVLRLSRVATLDATGASVLGDTIGRLERRGVAVLLSGIREDHAAIFERLGVFARLGDRRHVFESTPEAIAHARMHVARRLHEEELGAPVPLAG